MSKHTEWTSAPDATVEVVEPGEHYDDHGSFNHDYAVLVGSDSGGVAVEGSLDELRAFAVAVLDKVLRANGGSGFAEDDLNLLAQHDEAHEDDDAERDKVTVNEHIKDDRSEVVYSAECEFHGPLLHGDWHDRATIDRAVFDHLEASHGVTT